MLWHLPLEVNSNVIHHKSEEKQLKIMHKLTSMDTLNLVLDVQFCLGNKIADVCNMQATRQDSMQQQLIACSRFSVLDLSNFIKYCYCTFHQNLTRFRKEVAEKHLIYILGYRREPEPEQNTATQNALAICIRLTTKCLAIRDSMLRLLKPPSYAGYKMFWSWHLPLEE